MKGWSSAKWVRKLQLVASIQLDLGSTDAGLLLENRN